MTTQTTDSTNPADSAFFPLGILVVGGTAETKRTLDLILRDNTDWLHLPPNGPESLQIDYEAEGTAHAFSVDLQFVDCFDQAIECTDDAIREGKPFGLVFCEVNEGDDPAWTTIEQLWATDSDRAFVIRTNDPQVVWDKVASQFDYSGRFTVVDQWSSGSQVRCAVAAQTRKQHKSQQMTEQQDRLHHFIDERENELESTRAETEHLLSAIESLMICTDVNGVVTRWNDSAASIFGMTLSQTKGRQFADLEIQWDSNGFPKDLIVESKNGSTSRIEVGFVDKHDAARCVGLSGYPIRDGATFKGMLILGTDLTDHRKLEMQLHNAQKLEAVGQLAAGVAHEINTPMQYVGDNLSYLQTKFEKLIDFIKGSVELLEAAVEDDFDSDLTDKLEKQAKKLKLDRLYKQIPEALTDSIDGVGHVSRIVRAMKELSHPGGEEKTAVDVNKSLETTRTVSINEWKYVAQVELDLDANLDLIPAFPGELHQVFLNLIVNAAHAISDVTDGGNERTGKIVLRSRQMEHSVVVEICDDGGGIPESIRDRIFDPFFTTKEVGKGTGQGLAIAHSVIVQKHGGKLSFDVQEGVGTTFRIELPCDALQEEQAEQQGTHHADAASS